MNTKLTKLPSPQLPQMTIDNIIYFDDINAGSGVFVRIIEYSDAKKGDYIELYWDGKIVFSTLFDGNYNLFPITKIIEQRTNVGKHEVYYKVTDAAENQNISEIVVVNIKNEKESILFPSPVFMDEKNNAIFKDSIDKYNGVRIFIKSDIKINLDDMIYLYWNGEDSKGNVVYSEIIKYIVNEDERENGKICLIPKLKAINLSQGKISIYYQVWRGNKLIGNSGSNEARIEQKEDNNKNDNFDVSVSTGASITDWDAIHVQPFNQGAIKGEPGQKIILSATNGVFFNELNSQNDIVTLNKEGNAYFKISSVVTGEITISARDADDSEKFKFTTVAFSPYFRGKGRIKYINYTTNAPANGITPCSIYLKTLLYPAGPNNATISKVRVSVSGSAKIAGYRTQIADIDLHSDNSAEIDITNTVSERVNVVISLPEDSGSINNFHINFLKF